MPLVAQTSRGLDQLRERGLFESDKERVIARIAHRNHLMRLFGMRPRHLGSGPRMMLYLYDVASLLQMQSSGDRGDVNRFVSGREGLEFPAFCFRG